MAPRPFTIGSLLLLLPLLLPVGAAGGISSVAKNTDLQFGRLVSLGSSGTIMVSPAGARTVTGGVHLMPGGTVGAGTFTVTGTNNSRYTITLPANNSVVMYYRGSQIRLSNFTCSVPLTGRLSGRTLTFTVGATGTVTSRPTPGNYRGGFAVSVN